MNAFAFLLLLVTIPLVTAGRQRQGIGDQSMLCVYDDQKDGPLAIQCCRSNDYSGKDITFNTIAQGSRLVLMKDEFGSSHPLRIEDEFGRIRQFIIKDEFGSCWYDKPDLAGFPTGKVLTN